MRQLLILIWLTLSLQSCVFVVGAAAGMAGAVVVYDHRKIEKILMDERIAKNVRDKIYFNETLHHNTHIEVHCFNQVILLTGEVPTKAQRQQAENIVHQTPDVKRIYNQITIKGPSSKLTEMSDTWITTKIKTQMIATTDLKSSSIKVVTENGTVYLMGILQHDQAEIAVQIARQVRGVQRVIKIFQYKD